MSSSSTAVAPKDPSVSVPAYLFLPQEDYTPGKILCWGVCKKHFEIAKDSHFIPDRLIHGVIALIECVPFLGQLVSLVEAIASKVLGCCKLGPPSSETLAAWSQAKLDRAHLKFTEGLKFFETEEDGVPTADVSVKERTGHRQKMKEAYEEARKLGADLKNWDETLDAVDEVIINHYDWLSVVSIENGTLTPEYPDAKSFGWVKTRRVGENNAYIRPSYADLQALSSFVSKESGLESVYVLDIPISGKGGQASLIQLSPFPIGTELPIEVSKKIIEEAKSKGYDTPTITSKGKIFLPFKKV